MRKKYQPDLCELVRISIQEQVFVGWVSWYGFESSFIDILDRTESINWHLWRDLSKQNFLKLVFKKHTCLDEKYCELTWRLSFSCSLEPGGGGYQWICHRADKIKRKGQKSQIRQMNGGKIQPLSRTVAEGTSRRKIHLELLAEKVDEVQKSVLMKLLL